MAYLITAYQKKCNDCGGAGRRAEEDHACPTCNGVTAEFIEFIDGKSESKSRSVEPVAHLVDGRVYCLFPEEILEVENKAHAENILHHLAYKGVVEIKAKRVGSEIKIDRSGALTMSKDRILRGRQEAAAEYIRIQQDAIQGNKPASPPTGKYLEAVDALGIDLAALNIRPPAFAMAAQANLKKENQELKDQVSDLAAQVQQLTRLMLGKEEAKQPKQDKEKKAKAAA